MTKTELMTRMPATGRELPYRSVDPLEATDLFDRSLRRLMEEKAFPLEAEQGEAPLAFNQSETATRPPQQLVPGGTAGKSPAGSREMPASCMNACGFDQQSILPNAGAPGSREREEAAPSSLSGASAAGAMAGMNAGSHMPAVSSTVAASGYQDFSHVLLQQAGDAETGGTKEWRFSFLDSRMPLSQLNLTGLQGGGWALSLASGNLDREALVRRLDELQVKLARLNKNIEGVEIVRERSR
ncbi:hypothetical protein [Thiolapillus sp.]